MTRTRGPIEWSSLRQAKTSELGESACGNCIIRDDAWLRDVRAVRVSAISMGCHGSTSAGRSRCGLKGCLLESGGRRRGGCIIWEGSTGIPWPACAIRHRYG